MRLARILPSLGFAVVLGLRLACAQSEPDPPTLLPAYWVLAQTPNPDDLAARPFTLAREARSGRTATTLKDSLGDAPGVLLQESFGGFEPPRLSIRGSGLQSAPSSRGVAFLLDGFPLGLADGSFNSALVAPQLFERIELLRGDACAHVAPAVLGGVFNLRSGHDDCTALRTAAGSFGTVQASLAGGGTAGPANFNGAAAFARQDGFRAHSAQQRTALFAAAHTPTPSGCDTSISLYHARAAYDVPGPLTLATAQRAPHSVSTDVLRDQPRRKSSLTQLTAQTSQQNSLLAVDAGFSWLRSSDWFRQLAANGLSDSHSDDVSLHVGLTRWFDAEPGKHSLRFGTTLNRGWRDLKRFRNDAGALGPRFGHDGLFATTASADLEGSARFHPRLAFAAGITGLSARRDISDRLPATAPTTPTSLRLHSSTLQSRARLTWIGGPGWTVHASIVRATEPPTFDDLLLVGGSYPNLTRRSRPLANQRATTAELGTSATHGALGWDLTVYSANWHDEILRLADASGLPRGAVNAGPTQHQGVEASAHWRILDHAQRLSLIATAAWNRFTFANNPLFGDNRLAAAPPHQGSASLLYEHPRGLFVAPAREWQAGATPVDHANRLSYGGHTLAHLRIGWRHARTWTVFAEIKNLLDRQHIVSTAGVLDLARNPAATAVFLPGAGRTLTIGCDYSFR